MDTQKVEQDISNRELVGVLTGVIDRKTEAVKNELAGKITELSGQVTHLSSRIDEAIVRFESFAGVTNKEFERLENKVDDGFRQTNEQMNQRFDEMNQRFDRLELKHSRRLEVLEDRATVLKHVIEKDLKTKVAWT